MDGNLDNVPRIVRNETFYAFARISMIVLSVVGAPVGGYLLSRVISQSDAMTLKIEEQNVAVKVLSATVSDRLSNNLATLSDHELRLRSLEKRP